MLRPSVAHITFDAAQFDALRGALSRGELSPNKARLPAPPRPLGEGAPLVTLSPADRDERRAAGTAAIRAGRVAALILNGGMATRFGGVVKGIVPVIADRPDLSFLSVKLAALRSAAARAGGRVPV